MWAACFRLLFCMPFVETVKVLCTITKTIAYIKNEEYNDTNRGGNQYEKE